MFSNKYDLVFMTYTIRILRYNPQSDTEPYYREYQVEAAPHERILDVLVRIQSDHDSTLALRKSCGHGVCGSDAMLINGENRLACSTLVRDIKGTLIRVEPLPGAPVKRDLVLDTDRFWDKYQAVMPYLIPSEPAPDKERLQSPAEHKKIEESTKCILCGACTHACPTTWANATYLGPAALLKAYRFIFDSRDQATGQRIERIASDDGIWRCYTAYNCVEACPKDIDITWHISQLKKAAIRM
ncbi:succinate dehydrogenase iron-sulfur subunit [Prosthecochloris sp. ZM]|uniref:Succinate dehydrogenase iron-sulfur subunit n=2 Tax=Chlorobiaceae TaxID=191412 RepID=B4S6Q4_PROA2|nr:succinate dehydrogenase and fumarate reductase iron-sulfur protein [Prosthecochloris aestuarii DSM 271]RDD30676.1 succinate dehydrogenase iron-sulfur subunit [Prosthecochloris sp. ZM]